LNTLSKSTFSLILLAGVLVLPACGSKNSVKSETPGQNIVQPALTPESTIEPYKETTVISSSDDSSAPRPRHSYSKEPNDVKTEVVAAAPAKPVAEAVTPAPAASPVVAKTETKSGSFWLWILAAILALGGGYYFWTKKSPRRKGHPLPPMGGLSPVSGFTAMKDKVQSSKPSFWTKKLF